MADSDGGVRGAQRGVTPSAHRLRACCGEASGVSGHAFRRGLAFEDSADRSRAEAEIRLRTNRHGGCRFAERLKFYNPSEALLPASAAKGNFSRA
jgi:hypothetical protein